VSTGAKGRLPQRVGGRSGTVRLRETGMTAQRRAPSLLRLGDAAIDAAAMSSRGQRGPFVLPLPTPGRGRIASAAEL
jgi:hypothetical protein